RQAVKELATDLLKLYALRAASKGYAFPPDDAMQLELEARFEFEETPDQISAISAVKRDMEQPKPMDRLVCGDVGYGKTEVALRAAFKAIIAGKQVGVLVPTTLLAQQHYNTFMQRLQGAPIEVEMLSRFRTQKEQKQVLQRLEQGRIDFIIGTHRLLSKDVKFKNLGLLIIDEEHRFGVRHKEKIKSFKAQIDVLTLTATPIPRTLHLALINARDMSLIKTAPQDRLPIETEIAPFSEELIIEAIIREVDRGGQVYFVHNRVQSIVPIKDMLQRWMPEARFVVAHGQMPERLLEETMTDFLIKKYDVLVSTMIIESGLDLPNVNTMIINRADRFGLAQLYQLRGRIGRSNRQAYAYLLTPPKLSVSDPARKRLEAIRDCSYLGAGFQLAMHDLEIRGAGDIFGAKQSGFIHAVGFDLYQKMLTESVLELKQDSNLGVDSEDEQLTKTALEPKIDFPFDAYLPTDYVELPEHRVDLYRKLSGVTSHLELQSMVEEIIDRYGAPPRQARALFDLIEIKLGASLAGTPRLVIDENYFMAEVGQNDGEGWSQRLAQLIQNLQGIPVEFAGNDPPEIIYRWKELNNWKEKIAYTKKLLRKIA
ncbi:DEAD/DEAH box helicase, partial [bacterium]|nr:DEAD/DEAH box helicase [bacterium]